MEYVKVDLNFLKSQDQMRLNVRALLTTLQMQCEQMGYEMYYAARTNFCKLTHVDAKTGAEHELALSADPIGLSNVSSTLDFVWVSQGHDSLLPKKKAVEKRDYGLLGFPPKPADGAEAKTAVTTDGVELGVGPGTAEDEIELHVSVEPSGQPEAEAQLGANANSSGQPEAGSDAPPDSEGAPAEPDVVMRPPTEASIGAEDSAGTDIGSQKLGGADLSADTKQSGSGADGKKARRKKHKNKPPKPQPDPVAERLQQLARRADKIHSCLVVEGEDAIYARNMQWDDRTAYRQNHPHDSRGFIFKIPDELDLLRRFIKSDEELWHGF